MHKGWFGAGTASVLILEDHGIISMELAAIVEAMGFEVLGPFASPQEALDALAKETPVCALLDVDLGPFGDSLTVADELATRHVPFAFLTGRDDLVSTWIDRHGNRLLLAKPCRPSQVAGVMRHLCGFAMH